MKAGLILCLVLAMLQYLIKKERINIHYLRKNPMMRSETGDSRTLTYDQEYMLSEIDGKTGSARHDRSQR